MTYKFHGSYPKREDADAKATEVGGFVRERVVGKQTRYFVLTQHESGKD